MEYFKYIMLAIQFLLILLNFLGLPGNILSLAIPLVFVIAQFITWKTFSIILVIIISGEIIEFALGYVSGKLLGISGKSFWSSVAGAIILGILMAPLFFGLGAIIGVFAGCFIGTFIYEYFTTNNFFLSLKRSFFSLFSKITGTIIKISLGLSTIILLFEKI